MKKVALLLLLAIISFTSCENIEDNTPALQGEVNDDFFKANVVNYTVNEDGTLTIVGGGARETLSITIGGQQLGDYILGADATNYAYYENIEGDVYYTNPLGNGIVTLEDVGEDGSLTGKFQFMAVRPGVDTIYFAKGLFVEVPSSVFNDGGTTPTSDGTLSADINGDAFSPSNVSAVDTGNSIIITGTTTDTTIYLRVPGDVEPGTYNLPMAGFEATYSVNGQGTDASSGTITISSHNVIGGTIAGTFSFQAGANTITSGEFDVTY